MSFNIRWASGLCLLIAVALAGMTGASASPNLFIIHPFKQSQTGPDGYGPRLSRLILVSGHIFGVTPQGEVPTEVRHLS